MTDRPKQECAAVIASLLNSALDVAGHLASRDNEQIIDSLHMTAHFPERHIRTAHALKHTLSLSLSLFPTGHLLSNLSLSKDTPLPTACHSLIYIPHLFFILCAHITLSYNMYVHHVFSISIVVYVCHVSHSFIPSPPHFPASY